MKRRRNLIVTGVAAAVAAGCLVSLLVRDDAQHACLASVHAGLAKVSAIDPGSVQVEWKVLGEEYSDQLISTTSLKHPFDCGASRPGEPLRDDQGRPLKVGVRRSPGGDGVEFRVWSAGRDGKPGTWDDVVSPHGEKALTLK